MPQSSEQAGMEGWHKTPIGLETTVIDDDDYGDEDAEFLRHPF